MIEIDNKLAENFLAKNNIKFSEFRKIAGDCSFRSYYRVKAQDINYVLMFAPPQYEDLKPFIEIDELLLKNNLYVPKIHFIDYENGFLLLEDLGDISLSKKLLTKPELEFELYKNAIDDLIKVQNINDFSQIPEYNHQVLMTELMVFIDWYLKYKNISISSDQMKKFKKISFDLFDILQKSIQETSGAIVLRDYHADNLMVLDHNKLAIIDFQDAIIGSKAYDLVSILEDARRDVSPEIVTKIYDYYIEQINVEKINFSTQYEILSLQRNVKILGIFARQFLLYNRKNYLEFLPRVEKLVISRLQSKNKYFDEIKNFFDEIKLF